MAKYSLEFKLKLIQEIEETNRGPDYVGKKYDVRKNLIGYWNLLYKQHGVEGLGIKHGTYSGEFKESVLEYMKQNQLSLTETARYFKIPAVSTVTQWRNLAEKEGRSSLYEERRGQHFKMTPKKKKTDKIAIKSAAAISKGKYAKNTIPGIEGNQGPYKLTGAENETYIIVLSGTEKVFISGELMVRGQENDYVIDYNTAEITFTAKRLITKDSRISIEFEYSDKNYARSLFYSGVDYSGNKITTNLHFFTEQDLKNQAIQQELSDAENHRRQKVTAKADRSG